MSTDKTKPEDQQVSEKEKENYIENKDQYIITLSYNHNLAFDPKRGIAKLNHLFPLFWNTGTSRNFIR